jgi:hypothetical protein
LTEYEAIVLIRRTAKLKGITALATPYDTALTKTGDTIIDVVSHAITQLAAVGIAEDIVVLSASDSEAARLVKTSAGDYVLGDPAAMAATPALWGVRIIVDQHMPAGHFLGAEFDGEHARPGANERGDLAGARRLFHAKFSRDSMRGRVGFVVYVPNAWVYGATTGAVAASNGGKK